MFKNWKKYLSYILPTIIVMCINCTYNVVDQMFVGNMIGAFGLTALQTVGPLLLFLTTAFAAVFNSGGAIRISQEIGKNNVSNANKYFGNMIICHVIYCICGSIISFLFLNNFLNLFNISSEALTLAKQYGSIMIFGALFSALGPSLAFIFKNYGHPIISMSLISSSLILNIIFDAVLIPRFGISGAAYATIGSQFILFVIDVILLYVIVKKDFNIKLIDIKPNILKIKDLIKRGIPGLGDPISVFGTMLFHNIAITYYYNDSYLPIYNCLFGMDAIGMAIISGIILGIQPLLSKSYGESNKIELKNIFKFSMFFVICFGIISTILFVIYSNAIPLLFGLKGDLFTLAAHATLISCFTYIFFGPVKIFYIYYQSINKTLLSSLIAYIDIFVLLPLMLYSLPKLIGLNGIWLALPISKFIMLCLILFYISWRKLTSQELIESNFK